MKTVNRKSWIVILYVGLNLIFVSLFSESNLTCHDITLKHFKCGASEKLHAEVCLTECLTLDINFKDIFYFHIEITIILILLFCIVGISGSEEGSSSSKKKKTSTESTLAEQSVNQGIGKHS